MLLVTDQVVDLRSKGVGSAFLMSESGRISRDLVASKQDLEKSSLLFCAPEALMEGRWRDILEALAVSKRIVAVVIDEVRCVSKW